MWNNPHTLWDLYGFIKTGRLSTWIFDPAVIVIPREKFQHFSKAHLGRRNRWRLVGSWGFLQSVQAAFQLENGHLEVCNNWKMKGKKKIGKTTLNSQFRVRSPARTRILPLTTAEVLVFHFQVGNSGQELILVTSSPRGGCACALQRGKPGWNRVVSPLPENSMKQSRVVSSGREGENLGAERKPRVFSLS